MKKYLAVMTGAAAILAVATLTSSSVNAGGSSSAPSKYAGQQTRSNQQTADRQTFPITEYSSSSRHAPPKH